VADKSVKPAIENRHNFRYVGRVTWYFLLMFCSTHGLYEAGKGTYVQSCFAVVNKLSFWWRVFSKNNVTVNMLVPLGKHFLNICGSWTSSAS